MSLQTLTNFFKAREKIPLETSTQKKDTNYQHEKDSTDNNEKTELEGNSISSELGQAIIDFPLRHIDGQTRKFNADWYKRFSVIRYDVPSDSAFCGICRTFRTLSNHNNKTNFTEN
jgi:hypothetical protein